MTGTDNALLPAIWCFVVDSRAVRVVGLDAMEVAVPAFFDLPPGNVPLERNS